MASIQVNKGLAKAEDEYQRDRMLRLMRHDLRSISLGLIYPLRVTNSSLSIPTAIFLWSFPMVNTGLTSIWDENQSIDELKKIVRKLPDGRIYITCGSEENVYPLRKVLNHSFPGKIFSFDIRPYRGRYFVAEKCKFCGRYFAVDEITSNEMRCKGNRKEWTCPLCLRK